MDFTRAQKLRGTAYRGKQHTAQSEIISTEVKYAEIVPVEKMAFLRRHAVALKHAFSSTLVIFFSTYSRSGSVTSTLLPVTRIGCLLVVSCATACPGT